MSALYLIGLGALLMLAAEALALAILTHGIRKHIERSLWR